MVKVPGTEWSERALVRLSVNMPTGSTKSALYHYLQSIVLKVRKKCQKSLNNPMWLLGDATCEKMGDLMSSNGNRLLGMLVHNYAYTFISCYMCIRIHRFV